MEEENKTEKKKKKLNLKIITDRKQFMSKDEIYLADKAKERAEQQKKITEEAIKKKKEAMKKQAEVQKKCEERDTETLQEELDALYLSHKILEGAIAKLQLEGINGEEAKKLEEKIQPMNEEIDDLEWEINRRFSEIEREEEERKRMEDRIYPAGLMTVTFVTDGTFGEEHMGEIISEYLGDDIVTFNVEKSTTVVLTEDEKDNLSYGIIGVDDLKEIVKEQETKKE